MIRTRVASVALTGAFLLSLTACGGEDTPAASAPVAPASAPAATTQATTEASAADDKKLCAEAGKADKAMKAELIKAMKAAEGDVTNATMKNVIGGLADQLSAATAGAGDSEVSTAMKDFAAKAKEVSAAADPVTASEDPAFEKSGKDLTAACKAAGVTVNY